MTEETVHETEQKRSRHGISTFFRRIARRLGRGEKVPVDEEQTVAFDPPTEAEFEVEIEREGDDVSFEVEMVWDESDGEVDTDADESKATYQLYEGADGETYWRLRHDNGNIIADSGQGYTSAQKAKQGLDSVRSNAAGAHVVDLTRDDTVDDEESGSSATFEIFQDAADDWRWRLRHDNGNVIADCGQGYFSKQGAKRGLRSVKTNAAGASVEE